jgi:radical SAM protein (TIGR01212 family)
MSEKRFNAFTAELRQLFGCRVQRISVDAGFTCPNRDGSVASEGCIFCGGNGSGAKGIVRDRSVAEQLAHGKEFMIGKYGAGKFLAYFQAYSNTYAPIAHLAKLYDEALAVPDVVGLIVGTRPDCLPDDVLDLLADYSRKTYLWLELGLQSSVDRTLATINRGHDVACFAEAVERCTARGIKVCAHLIFGLPGETREEMLKTADLLNQLGIGGIKLHHLHVMKETRLEEMYQKGEIELLERDQYVGLVCDFLERLDPRILVMRLVGDGGFNMVAPAWGTAKFVLLNTIDRELERRGTRQGSSVNKD